MEGFVKIGKKIRYYRAKKGISKQEFARKIQSSVERLDRIEKGTEVYQFKTLEKIATILEITLPELLDFA